MLAFGKHLSPERVPENERTRSVCIDDSSDEQLFSFPGFEAPVASYSEHHSAGGCLRVEHCATGSGGDQASYQRGRLLLLYSRDDNLEYL